MPEEHTLDQPEKVDLKDYVSGGYFITCEQPRPDHISGDLFPPRLVSASGCLAPVLPDNWCFNWLPAPAPEERRRQAARFGIAPENIEQLCARITGLETDGDIGYDRTIFELSTARQLIQQFRPLAPGLLIIGLGLPRQMAQRLLAGGETADTGIYQAVADGQALAEGGSPLGFEATSFSRYFDFHSWLCGLTPEHVYRQFGLTVNRAGLFDRLEQAGQLAHYIQAEGKSEPGEWFPWLLVKYEAVE